MPCCNGLIAISLHRQEVRVDAEYDCGACKLDGIEGGRAQLQGGAAKAHGGWVVAQGCENAK